LLPSREKLRKILVALAITTTYAAGTVVPDGVEDAILVNGRTWHFEVASVAPGLRFDDLPQVLRVVAGHDFVAGPVDRPALGVPLR